jgi:hypothetical protein
MHEQNAGLQYNILHSPQLVSYIHWDATKIRTQDFLLQSFVTCFGHFPLSRLLVKNTFQKLALLPSSGTSMKPPLLGPAEIKDCHLRLSSWKRDNV